MRILLACLLFGGVLKAGTAGITVTPSVTYQTWHYWMALLAPTPAFGSAEPDTNPIWNTSLKGAMLGQLVNQLGMNTVQLTVASGDIENNLRPDGINDCWTYYNIVTQSPGGWGSCHYAPVNDDGDPNHFNCSDSTIVNCASFPLAGLDSAYDNYIIGPGGLKALVNANGENFHIVFQWIHWPISPTFLETSGAEVGEHILAAFTHISNKYGPQYVPDILDMMVEPDVHCVSANLPSGDCGRSGQWDFRKLGSAMAGIHTRLAAAGFSPQIWCCSTTLSRTAKDWYTNVKAQGMLTPNAFTTHWYDVPDTSAFAANAAQAAADNVPVVMTELDILTVDQIYDLITAGNVSGLEKYGMALISTNDVEGSLLMITSANPYASHYATGNSGPSYGFFFPQLWHYIRENDVREQAVSNDANFLPLAFRSPGGLDKVVVFVHPTGNQTINITGVNPGTYGCTYTYSNTVLLNPCGTNQTVGAGGTLTAALPAIPPNPPGSKTAAIVTFYEISLASTPGAPAITNVQNAATFQTTLAPSTYAAIFGQNLSTNITGRGWGAADFTLNKDGTLNMPTSLDGTSVTIGGAAAYINYVSPGQINIITPPNVTGSDVPVVVKTNGQPTVVFNVALNRLAPSFFTWQPGGPDSGRYLLAQHSDFTNVGKAGLFPGTPPGFTTPAKPGETIILYGTGFGPTSPPIANGIATDKVYWLNPIPTATLGGAPAAVVFGGLVPPLSQAYQFNVTIPPDAPDGDQALVVNVGGTLSTAGLITVQH